MLNKIVKHLKKELDSKWWQYIFFYNKNIEEKYIFFESYGGTVFQGNAYYIYKNIFNNEKYLDFKFIISAVDPNQLIKFLKKRKLYDYRVIVIKYNSVKYIKLLNMSKYLINNVTFPEFFIKKEEQIYINTWHGTPLKFLGKSINTDPFVIYNIIRDFLISDYIITPNKFTTKILTTDYMIDGILNGEVKEIGYPRNEIFFDDKYRHFIRQKERISDKKVIIYMPTWRGTANGNKRKIDYIKLMNELIKKLDDTTYVVYLKLHPLDFIATNFNDRLREVPKEYEIYEFLNACDILITDYSSTFFDFANTRKKIYLFQFDQMEYYKERGIYSEILSKVDLPISQSIGELSSQIIADENKITNISKEFIENFCLNDKNNPCEAVIKLTHDSFFKICNDIRIIIISEKICNEEIEKINNKYKEIGIRFLFIPKKSNNFFKNITCWKEINYLIGSEKERYFAYEKILFLFAKKLNFKFLNIKISKIKKREEMRVLGNLNIKKIYFLENREGIPSYLNGYKIEKIFN